MDGTAEKMERGLWKRREGLYKTEHGVPTYGKNIANEDVAQVFISENLGLKESLISRTMVYTGSSSHPSSPSILEYKGLHPASLE